MLIVRIIFVFLGFSNLYLFSQNSSRADSLLNVIKTALHDTTRFSAYLELGNYFQKSNPDTAIYFHTLAEKTTEKIPGEEGVVRKTSVLAGKIWDYYLISDYNKAMEIAKQVMALLSVWEHKMSPKKTLKFKKIKAIIYNNLGLVYYAQSNYSKALEYFFQALKINEDVDNKTNQASNLSNIGLIYSEQSNYSKALEYYFKALKIYENINDKKGQAINLGNIGTVFSEQGNYTQALDYYFQALKINEDVGNKKIWSSNYGNIGNVYYEQGKYTIALKYNFLALKINIEIGNKKSQAINLGNIGSIYLKQKKYQEAVKYLKQAERINRELRTTYYLKDNCAGLSELYEQTGRYREALHYYKAFSQAKDSVFSEENRKASAIKEMQYQYEKEQALKEKEHQKQLAVEKEKQEKQRVVMGFIIAGLILVIIFSAFVVNRLQITRRQKRIIEEQKQLVDEQKQLVEEQKQIVEQKNKDITDSIRYSKRIQDAILPQFQKWHQYLPESFILYLPKDIVAGDFYWMEVMEDYIYVAAADCTGHGVPGAMVSVVCSNALTKVVLEEKIKNTDGILNRVREIVTEKLTSEENIRDGMDICLIRMDKGTHQVQYSGANRPLYVVSNNELKEYNADKQPIGRYEESKPFTSQNIILPKNSILYLCTDGYADQFGGSKGKKIGTKMFKELLKENAKIHEEEKQKEHLISYFQEWKAEEEQMDDVTVLGIRI